VEFFVNERYQKYKGLRGDTAGTNFGCQYRVAADNIWLSGAVGNVPTTLPSPIGVFQASEKTRAWIKMENGVQKGYVVIMQAPWTFMADPDASEVFDSNGKPKVGAEIGFELQVNACAKRAPAESGRDAILTWNGIISQAYNNVGGYGIVTLEKRAP
jgi:hypothetical protein